MLMRIAFIFLLPMLLLGGCATTPVMPIWRPTTAPPETRTVIPVFFATDRLPSQEPVGSPTYLAAPFTTRIFLDRGNPVSYGQATGSIRRTGASLGPCEPGWWRQEEPSGKVKARFPLRAVDMMESDDFYTRLRAELDRLNQPDTTPPCEGASPLTKPGRRVLLYIHGFNDGFGEAAGNAAQLAYDLDIRAAPVIFSWPTQQSLVQYTRDETYAERAAPYLKRLIAGIVDKTAPDELYIIAHSMGSRITLHGLQELSTERSGRFVPATALILYAADLDTMLFQQLYMDELPKYARRTSVYANTHDIPLSVSRRVNGGYALGDFDGVPFTGRNFHTIDVSIARQSRLNHSGFEISPLITRQIQADLAGTPADGRPCLCRVPVNGTPALNPKGKEPYYRLWPDRPECPFSAPIFRVKGPAPACPD